MSFDTKEICLFEIDKDPSETISPINTNSQVNSDYQ